MAEKSHWCRCYEVKTSVRYKDRKKNPTWAYPNKDASVWIVFEGVLLAPTNEDVEKHFRKEFKDNLDSLDRAGATVAVKKIKLLFDGPTSIVKDKSMKRSI